MAEKASLFSMHFYVTLYETLLGFLLGVVIGIACAIVIVYSRFLANVIFPVIVILQIIPITPPSNNTRILMMSRAFPARLPVLSSWQAA